MSFVSDLVSNVVGSVTGQKQAAQAAKDAASTQGQYAQAGIDEQNRQFDAMVALLAPYVEAGTAALPGIQPYMQAGEGALQQQTALLGLGGEEAQRQAISGIESGAEFQALARQGENAMLQNASATGGLRGGNVQAALAQFRPELLQSLINQQYGRLGGLSDVGAATTQNLIRTGQASAAGTGAAGLESASSIAGLLGQQGAATAGGQLAYGAQAGNTFGALSGGLGSFMGAGGIPGIKKAFGF
jgi:hypothetical protein